MRLFRSSLLLSIAVAACGANAGVVSPEVEELIRANPLGSIEVTFYISTPAPHIAAREAKAEFAPQIKYLGEAVRALSREELHRNLTAVEIANRRRFLESIDDILNERGTRVAEALHSAAIGKLLTVENAIEAFGGVPLSRSAILPLVRGKVPAENVHELAKHPDVTYVDIHFVGGPLLDNQKESLGLTNAGGFWNNGIDGGVFDVGLIDSGVQRNHPAFAGFAWEGVTTDPSGHGTGVAGMMFSKNATYRGMAFGLHTVSAADANTGMQESTNWLLTETVQRAEAINVSWGGQTPDTTEYRSIEAYYDSAVDAFGITFGQAAGNSGSPGYETMVWPAKAYNTIAVANMYDQNTVTRGDDVIWNSSSRGPTPAGRKKPDIAAPGQETWSTTRTLGFGNLGGTSSAAPKVTGAAVLLRDRGLTSALQDKAVLINSANAWSDNNTHASNDDGPLLGSHWSRTYGWGYLNLLGAYQQAPFVIEDSFTRPVFVGLRRIAYYQGSRNTSFKATLVWNRHVGPYTGEDPIEYHSLTNFNLGHYNLATGALIAQSTSAIDNVEQVGSSGSGTSVLKVHTTGTWDIDVPSEDYALSTPSQFVRKTPPSYQITVNAPQYAVVGSEGFVSGTVTNTGELPVHNVLASVSAHVVGGTNPVQLGTLDPGESAPVNWQVQFDQSAGPQNVRITVDGSGYGETFSSFAEQTVEILPFFLAPSSYTVNRGVVVSGNLASVQTSNNVHMVLRPGVVFSTAQWPVEVVFKATSPVATPGHFYVRSESNATSVSLRQRFEVYNYNTASWVILDETPQSTTDVVRIFEVPGTPAHFQHPTTREVQIRLSARAFGPVFAYPWNYRIDQVGWHISG